MTCEAGSFFSDGLRDVGPSKAVDYPYIKRRDNLPEPKGKEKPVGLWSIIKDNVGNDLSGVSFPVYFNEPYLRCKNALKIWSTTTWLIRRWNRESRGKIMTFPRNEIKRESSREENAVILQ